MLEMMSCPVPLGNHLVIQMAHGGGGRLTRQLMERVFWRAFGDQDRHDSAVLDTGAGRVAFTTDSYVVHPLFFPGGDIGKLAVFGTVNDLAMAGATPLGLSCGFILEEGLPIETLEKVVASMQEAASQCGVRLVTGDTKVVDRGKGDGMFINTSGVGLVPAGVDVRPGRVEPGDVILLSGDLGRHGVAILSVREGLKFDFPIESDCGTLWPQVDRLIRGEVDIHCLRDLTRGGLASALNEIASDANLQLEIEEGAIPIHESVVGACELLGLDPLYVANEGRMVAFVRGEQKEAALAAMGQEAVCIGRVERSGRWGVNLKGRLGEWRALDLMSGEQLPRIC